jgi:hypothetical protein
MIMAYAFGKPVQPLAGAFQEQRHQNFDKADFDIYLKRARSCVFESELSTTGDARTLRR